MNQYFNSDLNPFTKRLESIFPENLDSYDDIDTFTPSYIDDVCLHTEKFEIGHDIFNDSYSDFDYSYLQNLRARAIALVSFLKNNKNYQYWKRNWELLEENLHKKNYYFKQLSPKNADIAHVINKGDKIGFRVRDNSGKYIPINIYQYVMCHELAHMATNDLQHTTEFWKLLRIMTFAMFELGLYDFAKLRKFHGYYNSNGQAILSLDSIKNDIAIGCNELKKANKNSNYDLYNKLINDL